MGHIIVRRFGILIFAAAVGLAALPAMAASGNGLAVIDLKKRCQNSERAALDLMGDKSLQGTAFDTCMRAEQEARKAIEAAWGDIPPSYKSTCIRPRVFSPSYVEWIACLEMLIDLKKLRSTNTGKSDSTSKRCPVIEYADDGSIRSIRACSL
jgi:hypothetical protein